MKLTPSFFRKRIVAAAFLLTPVIALALIPQCGDYIKTTQQYLEIGKNNNITEACYYEGLQDEYELDINTDHWKYGVSHTCRTTSTGYCTSNADQPCPGDTCAPPY